MNTIKGGKSKWSYITNVDSNLALLRIIQFVELSEATLYEQACNSRCQVPRVKLEISFKHLRSRFAETIFLYAGKKKAAISGNVSKDD